MQDDSHLYIDRAALAQRGWTRRLVERYLPKPDRWATVDHWLNYTGKALYFAETVRLAEARADFRKDFEASARRRGLSRDAVDGFIVEREALNAQLHAWLRQLTPAEVQRMELIDEVVREFEAARAAGYRTPHK